MDANSSPKNLFEFASELTKRWNNKTLEKLRLEAERERTGTAFEAIRDNTGKRLAIIVCITDVNQISLLESGLKLEDGGSSTIEKWNNTSLSEVFFRAIDAGGAICDSIRDEYGSRTALVLVASDSASVGIMESIFKMPE